MSHLQNDDVRISKAVKEGLEYIHVVLGDAVVSKLVPGIAGLCDGLY